MKRLIPIPLFLLLTISFTYASTDDLKDEAIRLVDSQKDRLIEISDRIWDYAETALKETRSSKELINYTKQCGFDIKEGVAGMPTAFIAEYGSGKPVIAVLGEYDALPGLSQKASAKKEPLIEGAPGHGCGHNLLGVASIGTAVAVKDLIAAGKLKGTIRYYGAPAEEAIGGKVYMTRDGFFNDVDVVLAWHPASQTQADTGQSLCMVDIQVEYFGKTAHGAADPWNGRSALDGVELFTHGLNMMREHVPPSVRMHYVIKNGGNVPNVVPDYAMVWCYIRDKDHDGVNELLKWVRKIADGAGLMAEVDVKFTINTGYYERIVNIEGVKLLHENLVRLGAIKYTKEELAFAEQLLKAIGVKDKKLDGTVQMYELPPPPPTKGSSDIGDVSWITPLIHLRAVTHPEGVPGHSWGIVACGKHSIGYKGMLYAAKAMALTAIDLFQDEDARERIRKEFEESTKNSDYKPYIPDGPPPIPAP